MSEHKKQNHLAHASSPYLLAHADNPVDWYEWSDEAFEKAASEDKPIFLSIGYNACHWCHVMEHESFENDKIARLLNDEFVSIKVDREERPDIDQIYMAAVMAMTGSGGWPMTIFMTPDRKPFFAGTYFPPEDRYGRPGFERVITELANAYKTQKDEIARSSVSIAEHIETAAAQEVAPRVIDKKVITSAANTIYAAFDGRRGGFGAAPKFPQPTNLSFLLRAARIAGEEKFADAALFTLRKMSEGGMYDQLGGGFHRYSVDENWLVPHFEKMLYDNALLVIPCIEAYQYSGDKSYLKVVDGILHYLQTEMTDDKGGFYSTEDADSEGEEGKFYVWSKKEIEYILGDDAPWFCRYYGVTDGGNFEHGRSILNIGEHTQQLLGEKGWSDEETTAKLSAAREKLLKVREARVHPAIDDKILASWNGLAIAAFAHGYLVTGDESYLKSARSAADFVLGNMISGNTISHSYRQGQVLKKDMLEDYAYFVAGLIDLYQASFDEKYLNRAAALAHTAVGRFYADEQFYSAPSDDPYLIFRPRDLTDGATPSPSSVMIYNLLRLGGMLEDEELTAVGKAALTRVSGMAARIPQASGTLLMAAQYMYEEPVEVVVVGNDPAKRAEFNSVLFARFLPNKIIVGNINGEKSELPLLRGRQDVSELTYYFCKNKTCRLPVTEMETFKKELDWLAGTAQ